MALELLPAVEAIEARLHEVGGRTRSDPCAVAEALAAGLISPEEAALLARYERIRAAAVAVDDFPRDLGRTARAPEAAARAVA